MAENKKRDENLLMNLAHLRKRALDVKFDLNLDEYQPIESIGIGAYGVVCSAIHKKTNDRVAIKKIPNVFDLKDIAKRTYREIKILKHFKHDNIIHIREILKPKETLADFRDVYVVFDLMESDLHKIIYSKQELSEEHVRYFLYQILRGLKYIHSAHVIHRDLKPSNLLVNEDCQLRIGDFGMARGISSCPVEPNYFMTQYVATRWYRAPEIMLSLIEYGAAVDMWSVGCIFAEMLGRKHLFPGKDAISQIKLIVGTVGSPNESLLSLCQSPIIKNFFQEMGKKEPIPMPKLFPKASKKAIYLLNKMLVLHPKERITVEQALVHPYLNKYHDPDDEPICVPAFNFDFEKEELSVDQIRESIGKEVMEYHQPRTPTFSFNAMLRPVPKVSDSTNSTNTAATTDTNSPFFFKVTDTTKLEQDDTKDIPGDNVETKSEPKLVVVSPVREKPQQIIITKTENNDDEVFKKPLSAKNTDLQTETALKLEPSDIEMLSAKSEDGKQPMSVLMSEKTKENQEPGKEDKNKTISDNTKSLIKAAIKNASFKKRTGVSVSEEKTKENQEPGKEDKNKTISDNTKSLIKAAIKNASFKKRTEEKTKENQEPGKEDKNKTISDNTKSLIKAAIKNASFKKRTDSVGDDDKPKPITAAMRQKEREDKRKKKKERTMQKKMKEKKKNSAEEILTSEDKELLQRWTKMQKVNVPIAPKPATVGSAAQIAPVILTTVSNTDQGSSQQKVQSGDSESDKDKCNCERVQSSSERNVQKGTLDLLQQKILLSSNNNNSNNQNNSHNITVNRTEQTSSQVLYNNDLAMTNRTQATGNIDMTTGQFTTKSDSLNLSNTTGEFNVDFSTVSLGDIDFLSMVTSPDLTTLANDAMIQPPQNTNVTSTHENYHDPAPVEARCQSDGLQAASLQHGSPHQLSVSPNYHDSAPIEARRQSDGLHPSSLQHGSPHQLSVSPNYHDSAPKEARRQSDGLHPSSIQHGSPHHLSVSPNYPNHTSPPQYYQSHSPGSHHSVSPDHRVSPNLGYQQNTDFLSQQQPAQIYGHQINNQSTDMIYQNHNTDTNRLGNSHMMQYQAQNIQTAGNQTNSVPFQHHNIQESRDPASEFLIQSLGNQTQSNQQPQPSTSQNFMYRSQTQGPRSNSNSNSPPLLSINTQQAQMSFQHLFQPIPGPSQTQIDETQVDLIAILSKQLSKSNVGDACPPLALTPRGTGGGYGLGMDLDALMGSTESTEGQVEPSPLSSSILADWMEVTGNMNIDMDALEQELQSPMALSYNDLNLYSS